MTQDHEVTVTRVLLLLSFLILMLASTSAAAESNKPAPLPPLPERPAVPAAVDGECAKTYPLRRGHPLPAQLLQSPSAVALCSGVVVPLSDYADLLATEKWAGAVVARYRIDLAETQRERDWYADKLEQETQPDPWLERPSTQRWFGRLETLVTVGVVAVGLGAAYQYGSGSMK